MRSTVGSPRIASKAHPRGRGVDVLKLKLLSKVVLHTLSCCTLNAARIFSTFRRTYSSLSELHLKHHDTDQPCECCCSSRVYVYEKQVHQPETAAMIFMRSPRIPKVLFCAVDPFSHIWAPLDSSLSSSSDKLSIPLKAISSMSLQNNIYAVLSLTFGPWRC